MFGRKKEKIERAIPLDRIRAMARTGMSDRDIIKQLKSEGYGYAEIENAMMQAVKQGVEGAEYGKEYSPTPAEYEPAPSPVGPPGQLPGPAEFREFKPEFREEVSMPFEAPAEEIEPEVIMEELIEGVVEDKFTKFDEKIRKVVDDFSRLELQLKQIEDRISKPQTVEIPKEFEDRLQDLEARIGGLERAFKQFLPSLTQNIESLSQMIHEMKASREVV